MANDSIEIGRLRAKLLKVEDKTSNISYSNSTSSITGEIDITGSLYINSVYIDPTSFNLTAALAPYATSVNVSSSITSAISSFPTRTEVTGALSAYATATSISASFTTPSQVSSSITSAIGNFPTKSEVSSSVTGALSSYATLVGVSSSFSTPSQVSSSVTSALGNYATSTNVSSSVTGAINTLTSSLSSSYATKSQVSSSITGALASYATLTGVSASFTTPSQVSSSVTGALGSYATLTGVSASFSTPSQVSSSVTGALSSYATSTNVSSSITSSLTNYATSTNVSSSVTGAINVLTSSLSSSYARLAAANVFSANQTITGTMNVSSTGYFAGNVGIGTATTPSTPLHINKGTAAGSGNDIMRLQGEDVWLSIYSGSSTPTRRAWIGYGDGLATNNFTITNQVTNGHINLMTATGGNVGIGTASPTNTLDVNGAISLRGNRLYHSSSNYQIEFGPGAGSGVVDFYGIYAPPGKNIAMYSSGSITMALSGGNVGVGTSAPSAATGYTFLTVQNGTNGAIVEAKDTGVILRMQTQNNSYGSVGTYSLHPALFYMNGAEKMRLDTNGNVSVGALASPAQTLDINGTLRIRTLVAGTNTGIGRNASGDITAISSDRRLKKNIQVIDNALNKINLLNGVSFYWDNDNDPEFIISDTEKNKQIGLIAQDVEKVFPELVYLNGIKDYKSIRYPEISAILIQGIKELSLENDYLRNKLAEKDKQIEDILLRLTALEK